MPDNRAQFEPPLSDYQHDVSLAQAASLQVLERLALGEDRGTVIRDVIAKNARAYIGEPWTLWGDNLGTFLTAREAVILGMMEWKK